MSAPAPQTTWRVDLSIALALSVGCTALLGFYPPHVHIFTGDGLEQIQLAQCLARGEGLACPALGYWPPLFPLLTWLASSLTATQEAAARLVACLAGGAVPAVVYDLSRRIAGQVGLRSPRAAGVAAAGLAFAAPHGVFYATMGDNRALYQLMAAITLWACVRAQSAGAPDPSNPGGLGSGWLLVAGAAGALGALTRPEGKALVVLAAATGVLRWWQRRATPRAYPALGLAPVASLALYLPYLYALKARADAAGWTVEPRAWEMAVMSWANVLPKDLILGLMGFTVVGTPLRARMGLGLAQGEVTPPDLLHRLGDFAGVYVKQLPETLGLAWEAIPLVLLALAPVGAFVLLRRRAFGPLALIALTLAPYLLFPGLPQSSNDKIPSGNFLSALAPLAALSTAALAAGLARLPDRWRALAPAVALSLSLALTTLAVRQVAHIDSDLHLFEGQPLPRGAGEALARLLPEGGRLVTTYPGTAVAHFARLDRTPMPTSWELGLAMERWQDKPTLFVLVHPDLTDRTLLVSELMAYVPDPCEPVFQSRGDADDWVFACRIGGP